MFAVAFGNWICILYRRLMISGEVLDDWVLIDHKATWCNEHLRKLEVSSCLSWRFRDVCASKWHGDDARLPRSRRIRHQISEMILKRLRCARYALSIFTRRDSADLHNNYFSLVAFNILFCFLRFNSLREISFLCWNIFFFLESAKSTSTKTFANFLN